MTCIGGSPTGSLKTALHDVLLRLSLLADAPLTQAPSVTAVTSNASRNLHVRMMNTFSRSPPSRANRRTGCAVPALVKRSRSPFRLEAGVTGHVAFARARQLVAGAGVDARRHRNTRDRSNSTGDGVMCESAFTRSWQAGRPATISA